MSFRVFLVGVWKTLYSLMSRLFWGGMDKRRKLHLVDWKIVINLCVRWGSLDSEFIGYECSLIGQMSVYVC